MELVDFLFFVEVLVGGLLSGIMYSLVALGLVLIFKASSIFNFAQGALVLFGALTFVLLTEVAGDFWMWTGWLAIVLAGASAVMYFLYTAQQKEHSNIKQFADKYLKRVPLFVAAVLLLVLALFVDGGQNMWRAVFVTMLLFLMLTTAVQSPKWAIGVLLGLAVVALITDGAVTYRAFAVTLVVVIGLAMAIERIVLRPMVNQEPIILFMATIGLNYVIEGVAQGVWDADVHALDIGIPDIPFDVGGVYLSQFDLYAGLIAAILVTALAIFFQKTRVGRALRAVADDHQAALSVGIPLKNIWAVVWAAAGIVALVAGLMWGSKLGVQFSISLLAFKALPVIIIGGFTSIPGAIVGGLIVGATEKLFEVFVGLPYFGGGTENWTPYMLGMIFLMFRPQGLFGEKIIERV
ncbi:MAG: branched-chain amino acid ABC transporter permease [Acidiferrobacterales bacterium]|nr:branched-chain amino acid ABC transporter permease [Acidiferrobacterales bacterium]